MTLAELQSKTRGKPLRKPTAWRACEWCGTEFAVYNEGRRRSKRYCDCVCSDAANKAKEAAKRREAAEARQREAACVALANEVLG